MKLVIMFGLFSLLLVGCSNKGGGGYVVGNGLLPSSSFEEDTSQEQMPSCSNMSKGSCSCKAKGVCDGKSKESCGCKAKESCSSKDRESCGCGCGSTPKSKE